MNRPQFCEKCKIEMTVIWDEMLGAIYKCDSCLQEKLLRWDHKRVSVDRIHSAGGGQGGKL